MKRGEWIIIKYYGFLFSKFTLLSKANKLHVALIFSLFSLDNAWVLKILLVCTVNAAGLPILSGVTLAGKTLCDHVPCSAPHKHCPSVDSVSLSASSSCITSWTSFSISSHLRREHDTCKYINITSVTCSQVRHFRVLCYC